MIATYSVLISLFTFILLRLRRDSVARAKNEPPILPYWIPFIGHVFRYSRDSQKLFFAARDFSPDAKPVSLTILGKRIYIVTSERDISAVYRSKNLQFTPIVVRGLQDAFDMSKEGLDTFTHQPDGPNSSLEASMHSYYRDAMREGPALEELATRFVQALERDLRAFDHELGQGGRQTTEKPTSTSLDLYDWVKLHFGTPSTIAIMGEDILKHKPDLLDGLWRFEADFPKLTLGMPRWAFRKENAHRDEMVAAFRHVYENDMQGGAVWWITERQELVAKAGFSAHDLSVMTFGVWVASEINAKAASFWLLAHILNSPTLATRIRAETAFAFSKGADPSAIAQLVHKAPLLRSMYHEVLRVCSSSISFRTVEEDATIGGYTFRKGALVMCPALPRHFDSAGWGPDAGEFVADRFIRPNGGKVEGTGERGLLRGDEKLLRPFGGGTSLCPGRYFAAQEVVAFVAMVLHRYDIQFSEGERMPEVDMGTPVAGTLGPVGGLKVVIRLRV